VRTVIPNAAGVRSVACLIRDTELFIAARHVDVTLGYTSRLLDVRALGNKH
jgi:hypothetical protein